MPEQLAFDVDPAEERQQEAVIKRLPPHRMQELEDAGLKRGAVRVWRDQKRIFATGDIAHCPEEDIWHNIRALEVSVRARPEICALWKSFEADITEYGKPIRKLPGSFFKHHSGPVWQLHDDGTIEEVRCSHKKWAQMRKQLWECMECHERLSTDAFSIRYDDVTEAYEKHEGPGEYADYTLTRTVHDG
jgi:hypothetical protein